MGRDACGWLSRCNLSAPWPGGPRDDPVYQRARELRLRELSPPEIERPAQEISVDWWCTMIRRASPEVAGAHTLDSSEAPPSQRTR